MTSQNSIRNPEAFAMRIAPIDISSKVSIRDKARLNICIAKDLADSFGGRKADYLIRLNRKLKVKSTMGSVNFRDCLSMAA
jgi:hypothetical protein